MEGTFKWIEIDLQEIAKTYSKTFEEITTMFEQVNCSKTRLVERLNGDSFCAWKRLEDLILETHYNLKKGNGGKEPERSAQYMCLIEEKGLDEIEARNKFLGFVF